MIAMANITQNQRLHKHPQYIWFENRLCTFTMWPPQLAQNKRTMARCGLFYSNVSDRVTCFSCGVTLFGWKLEDDPWIEHQRLSKDCLYLQMVGVESHLNSDVTQCRWPASTYPFMDYSNKQTASICQPARDNKMYNTSQDVWYPMSSNVISNVTSNGTSNGTSNVTSNDWTSMTGNGRCSDTTCPSLSDLVDEPDGNNSSK